MDDLTTSPNADNFSFRNDYNLQFTLDSGGTSSLDHALLMNNDLSFDPSTQTFLDDYSYSQHDFLNHVEDALDPSTSMLPSAPLAPPPPPPPPPSAAADHNDHNDEHDVDQGSSFFEAMSSAPVTLSSQSGAQQRLSSQPIYASHAGMDSLPTAPPPLVQEGDHMIMHNNAQMMMMLMQGANWMVDAYGQPLSQAGGNGGIDPNHMLHMIQQQQQQQQHLMQGAPSPYNSPFMMMGQPVKPKGNGSKGKQPLIAKDAMVEDNGQRSTTPRPAPNPREPPRRVRLSGDLPIGEIFHASGASAAPPIPPTSGSITNDTRKALVSHITTRTAAAQKSASAAAGGGVARGSSQPSSSVPGSPNPPQSPMGASPSPAGAMRSRASFDAGSALPPAAAAGASSSAPTGTQPSPATPNRRRPSPLDIPATNWGGQPGQYSAPSSATSIGDKGAVRNRRRFSHDAQPLVVGASAASASAAPYTVATPHSGRSRSAPTTPISVAAPAFPPQVMQQMPSAVTPQQLHWHQQYNQFHQALQLIGDMRISAQDPHGHAAWPPQSVHEDGGYGFPSGAPEPTSQAYDQFVLHNHLQQQLSHLAAAGQARNEGYFDAAVMGSDGAYVGGGDDQMGHAHMNEVPSMDGSLSGGGDPAMPAFGRLSGSPIAGREMSTPSPSFLSDAMANTMMKAYRHSMWPQDAGAAGGVAPPSQQQAHAPPRPRSASNAGAHPMSDGLLESAYNSEY